MKSVSFTTTCIPAVFYIILLSRLAPTINFGVDGRLIAAVKDNCLEIRDLHGLVAAGQVAMHEGDFPEQQPSLEEGMELFAKKGCVACHDTDVETEGKLGPRIKGLLGSVRYFEDGKSEVADANYIRQSILAPTEKVVKGYPGVMPPYGSILTHSEVESVVLYIKSL